MSSGRIRVASGRYPHPRLGIVRVCVRRNARNICGKWQQGEFHISVPATCPQHVLDSYLSDNMERIESVRPVPRFTLDMIIDAGEIDITIMAADKTAITLRQRDTLRGKKINFFIQLAPDRIACIGTNEGQKDINRRVLKICAKAAPAFLLPLARECADKAGCKPLYWEIKDSKRAWGRCFSDGHIVLSPRLMFLPDELRRSVIFHELAHLSEMNHSQAFHKICDTYLGGREQELSRRLKQVRLPVE